jgi:hypothetical protein
MRLGEFRFIEASLHCGIIQYQLTVFFFGLGRHNLGLNHDKGTKDACASSAYNYGFRDPSAGFRSILSYNCKSGQCDGNAGGGCTRVQRFSNDEFLYEGKAIGSALHDNARKINEVRATVAAYRTPANTNPPSTCPAGHGILKLVLLLDNYPGETTWQVVNGDGTSVASGGPYDDSEEILYEECLPFAENTFTITDSYGDGICCGYGQGSYKIYWSGALVASGGEYLGSISHTFGQCVNYAGWKDKDGDGCSWYETNESPGCPDYGDYGASYGGIVANEACCHCHSPSEDAII